MLQLPESVYRQLRRHSEETYPHECCGVLVGAISGGEKIVVQAIPLENASLNDTRKHYGIDPLHFIRTMRETGLAGHEILGFYHSHPDHPAHWSATDLAEAHWLGCSYVITSVAGGAAAETRSFDLAGSGEEDKRFEQEEIQIVDAETESKK